MSMADAFASIASGFSGAFGAPFASVTARWPGNAVYDAGGSIVTPAPPVDKVCQAQFDAPTEAMRSDPGFMEKDVRVIVLAASLDGILDTSAKIIVASGDHAGTWSLETCNGDSASIGWECRARRISL